MSSQERFHTILSNYLKAIPGAEVAAVCDRNGFMISSVGREGEANEEIIGAISVVLDSYIDRIKKEFLTESNFFNVTATGNQKFAFCSMGQNAILTTLAEPGTSDVELRVFSEYVAKKIEELLEGKEISLEIPDIIKALSKTRDGTLPAGNYSNKVIFTGDYKVGKTSLIKRFVTDSFQENYLATMGVEILKKILYINDDIVMNFIIWDIAGQQLGDKGIFKNPAYFRGANAAFIVIDRTRSDTLENINAWNQVIKDNVQEKIPIIIVGNKSDLVDNYEISEEDIKRVAEKLGFDYILTSAKTGENVTDSFLYLSYRILQDQ